MDENTNKRLGELIFDLARGNVNALEDIYNIMCKILYAIGTIYYNQRADIEDAIQNLLITLYYRANKFKKNTNACAWIIRIYQNSIKNQLLHIKREEAYLEAAADKILTGNHNDDDNYLENHLFVNEIFGKLNEYERDLIVYRYWCKCSIKEVADICGKPKSTIETHLKNLEENIKNF